MNHIALVEKFYRSFAAGDLAGMISCYHKEIEFEDPAFGKLKNDMPALMWKMLLDRAKGDLKITYGHVKAGEKNGSAKWEAHYHFGEKRRKVINRIQANFEFRDGLIYRHTDSFDVWKWSSQALGMSGYILGWSSYMKQKIRQKSLALLNSYITQTSH
jgi:ketosteroid isomerase-like protein